MGLFSWAESKTKDFHWYDFGVLKLSMLVFGLWLAIVLPDILGLPTWVYFVVFIIGWLYLIVKLFKR